jgi:hypothetical protein
MNHEKATFESVVKNGRFEPEVADSIRKLLARMEGKKLRLEITKATRIRSGNQNRYYWGVVVDMIWGMFVDAGNDVTREECHDFLKAEVGRSILDTEIVDPQGECHSIAKSTTRLTTMEFESYLERCREWAARMGLVIPLPNEVV